MLENQMIEAGLHEQFQQLSDEEKIQLFNQMLQGGFEEGEEEGAYGEEEGADMEGEEYGQEFDLNNYGPEDLEGLDPEILQQLQEQQRLMQQRQAQ